MDNKFLGPSIMTIDGEYSSATVYAVQQDMDLPYSMPDIDEHAKAQIKMICDNPVSKGSKIAIMPDVHAGKVGPIGLSMTLENGRIMPALLGPDIGCGVICVPIYPKRKLTDSNFQQLDVVIRDNIPSGSKSRSFTPNNFPEATIGNISFITKKNDIDRIARSYGTLGGGNHFIEIDQDDEGQYYLTIHTGSRTLGAKVYSYWMDIAKDMNDLREDNTPYEIGYLEDEDMKLYLRDVALTSTFADFNREEIVDIICKKMKWDRDDIKRIHTQHNFYDHINNILRKGACSAYYGQEVIIPINMKEGIIIGKGKGSEKWNCSCPHGSGRLIKRSEVPNFYTVNQFKKEMNGVYSSCINKDTLDEAPFAYRKLHAIESAIEQTVEIEKVIYPVYNFKAGGE